MRAIGVLLVVLLMVASLFLGIVKIGRADIYLDEEMEWYSTGDSSNCYVYVNRWEAQIFTVGTTGRNVNFSATHIKLKVWKYGTPVTPFVYSIRAVDANNKPTGLDLCNGTSDPTTWSTDATWMQFDFNVTSGYELQEGIKYAICMRSPNSPNSGNSVALRYDSDPSSYAGGNDLFSDNAGGTWTTAHNDFMFEVWGLGVDSYNYVIHGPYLEDSGLAYNGIVNVTLTCQYSTPISFALNGTSGTAETVTIYSSDQATLMTWNITTDYNYSRIYAFRNDTHFDEVWLYVPNLANVILQYTITVIDFAGLTNATVETDKNILGYNRIVERQNFDVYNGLAFWLTMYSQYTLKVVSDQGTFMWSLTADGVQAKTFIVSADMIPYEYSGENATVTATRNATLISVYYSESRTTWVNTTVYLVSSVGYTYVTHQLDSGTTQNYTVAISATSDYLVKIIAFQNGEVLSWQFALPKPAATTNIWTGIFEMFGIWPFNPANAVGMFIVLLFFCVGSWSDTEFFLGAGIVLAAVLTFLGWMNIPWLGISTALMVVFLMYIHKGKQEIREL